jgi:hypothetical protein
LLVFKKKVGGIYLVQLSAHSVTTQEKLE